MTFLVRNASNRDTSGIVQVVSAVYEEYGFTWDAEDYHADLYDIEKHYWRDGHAFWVAETLDDEPQVIGTCAIGIFEPLPLGGESTVMVEGTVRATGADCSLERLYVDPNVRRIGAGLALFEHCIAYARSMGKRRMEIWSDKRFEAAHRLYMKLGAEIVGERICHDPDQSPEFGLILPLR